MHKQKVIKFESWKLYLHQSKTSTKMECVIGHKIDYIGVGVVRRPVAQTIFQPIGGHHRRLVVIFLYDGVYVQARLFAAVYLPTLGVCISCCGVSVNPVSFFSQGSSCCLYVLGMHALLYST